MATRTIVQLTDDVDGKPAAETVRFTLDSAAVRAWAASNGIELFPRGRLPHHVVDQYGAAGN